MKVKIYLSALLFCFVFGLSSCNSKEDALLPGNSTDRVNKKIKEYEELLIQAEHGWVLSYKTEGGMTANFSIQFLANNRVSMTSDISSRESNSSWRLSPEQSIILSFDTYSLLHILADPEVEPRGKGYLGDYEFILGDIKGNTIELIGRKHKKPQSLVKLTSEDIQYMADVAIMKEKFFTTDSPIFKNVVNEAGETLATVLFSYDDSKLDFYYQGANGRMTHHVNLYYEVTPQGATIVDPVPFNDGIFTELTAVGDDLVMGGTDLVLKQSNIPTTFSNAYQMFYADDAWYIAVDFSAEMAAKYKAFQTRFNGIVGLQYYTDFQGKSTFAAVYRGKATEWYLLMCDDPTKGPEPDVLYLNHSGSYASSGSTATPELRKEICESEEYIAIVEALNVDGKGSSIMPINGGKGFYIVSRADSNVWIKFETK